MPEGNGERTEGPCRTESERELLGKVAQCSGPERPPSQRAYSDSGLHGEKVSRPGEPSWRSWRRPSRDPNRLPLEMGVTPRATRVPRSYSMGSSSSEEDYNPQHHSTNKKRGSFASGDVGSSRYQRRSSPDRLSAVRRASGRPQSPARADRLSERRHQSRTTETRDPVRDRRRPTFGEQPLTRRHHRLVMGTQVPSRSPARVKQAPVRQGTPHREVRKHKGGGGRYPSSSSPSSDGDSDGGGPKEPSETAESHGLGTPE